MNIDLSKFKVVYKDTALKAVALINMEINPKEYENKQCGWIKPKMLEVMVINEDGNIRIIIDEAWCFQFIPVVNKD